MDSIYDVKVFQLCTLYVMICMEELLFQFLAMLKPCDPQTIRTLLKSSYHLKTVSRMIPICNYGDDGSRCYFDCSFSRKLRSIKV